MFKYLACLATILLMVDPTFAQSPFQSAPGPAPPPAPHPRPAIQSRPAPRSQEDLPPTVTMAPAPTVAPQPPPAPPPPSLAGVWHFWSNCPLDPGADLTLTSSGPEQYRISGVAGLLPIPVTGWVSGKLVHAEADPPLNHVVSEGTVESPTAMRGKTTSSLGINCEWAARKK